MMQGMAGSTVQRRSTAWWFTLDAVLLAALAFDAWAHAHPARAVLLILAAVLFVACAVTDPAVRRGVAWERGGSVGAKWERPTGNTR